MSKKRNTPTSENQLRTTGLELKQALWEFEEIVQKQKTPDEAEREQLEQQLKKIKKLLEQFS